MRQSWSHWFVPLQPWPAQSRCHPALQGGSQTIPGPTPQLLDPTWPLCADEILFFSSLKTGHSINKLFYVLNIPWLRSLNFEKCWKLLQACCQNPQTHWGKRTLQRCIFSVRKLLYSQLWVWMGLTKSQPPHSPRSKTSSPFYTILANKAVNVHCSISRLAQQTLQF